MEAPCPFPHALPFIPLHLIFSCILCNILYNKPVNVSISPNSVSCPNKLVKREEEVVETLINNWLFRGVGDNPFLVIGISHGNSLWD
jgi:hypothetical protein